MKTRIYIMMLALSFFVVLCAFAAEKGAGEAQPAVKTSRGIAVVKVDSTDPNLASTDSPFGLVAPFDFISADSNAALLKTEMEKVSYVIGTQIGQSFKQQGIEIILESLIMGLKDQLADKELALSAEEIQKVMTSFRERMMAKQAAEKARLATKNLIEGQAFLEANKAKEGVQVLPSGLQYKVITEGTGEIPTIEDKVRTHYRGTLIDGTEFDSSYKRNKPAEFAVKGVIKGWTEALQLMKVGSKWELYIPADLAYGERGRPTIPPNSTLIFEIELLEIVKAAEPAKVTKPTIEIK